MYRCQGFSQQGQSLFSLSNLAVCFDQKSKKLRPPQLCPRSPICGQSLVHQCYPFSFLTLLYELPSSHDGVSSHPVLEALFTSERLKRFEILPRNVSLLTVQIEPGGRVQSERHNMRNGQFLGQGERFLDAPPSLVWIS